ncbi:MAG: serpin family protein [Lachnospiraceae bacterium]|nr:serpin family protein [Lachnospiraceae bacterium]
MKKTVIRRAFALFLTLPLLLSLAACGAGEIPVTEPAGSASGTESPDPLDPTVPTTAGSVPSPVIIGKAEAADLMERFTAESVAEAPADARFREDLFRFAAEIFTQIYSRDGGNKTTLISPLSILTALAMTANGAEEETLREMESVLCGAGLTLDDLNAYLHTYLNALPDSDEASFAFANSIWFKDMEGFAVNKEFLQKNVNYYGAGVYKAPFDLTTVRDINQWVAAHTHDIIPSLLNDLDESARMVLINALVFEAKWASPFDSEYNVHPDSFTGLSGQTKTVDQMTAQERIYLSDATCRGFMKPYAGGSYRFVALLPEEGVDFNEFVLSLTGEKLSALLTQPKYEKVNIKLPKFSYDYDQSLVEALKALGMEQAFTDRAQFGGIGQSSRDAGFMISDVLHKTHIDVDNEGTRAAAVTAVMVVGATAVPRPEEIHEVYLDRPFVYMIVDSENSLPLFIGTVTELGD